MGDEKEWWISGSHHGHAFFSPRWPHHGKEGEVLYVSVTPARGWRVFVAGAAGHGIVIERTFQEALDALPSELHEKAHAVHRVVIEQARKEAQTWRNRYRRYKAEATQPPKGA